MREFFNGIPGDQRQIISEKGIPVRIIKNPEESMHRGRISLGVGGMIEMGKIQDPILREEADLQRQVQELEARLQADAYARVREVNPEATLEYSDYPLNAAMMEMILSEDASRREEIEEARARVAAMTKKRYQFEVDNHDNLFVGKEGALIYSVQTGERVADELKKAVVWRKDEPGVSKVDPEWAAKIAALRERILHVKSIADIHQVEVLPEFQGKGFAKALLDVALWDIEHTRDDVEFSVARILSDNPDGKKMIAAFKKAGFEAFEGGRISRDDPREFTIVLRENPHFNSKKDRMMS